MKLNGIKERKKKFIKIKFSKNKTNTMKIKQVESKVDT